MIGEGGINLGGADEEASSSPSVDKFFTYYSWWTLDGF